MKMLPTLGRDSSVTENGHMMVRPAPSGHGYEVVNTVTDAVASYADPVTGKPVPFPFVDKSSAEARAVRMAEAALDLA